MTAIDELSRLLAAERATAPPGGVGEEGLNRLLTSLAANAAPLPVAVGALPLGWSTLAKWAGVGFAVGLAGAGAATMATSEPTAVAARVVPTSAMVAPLSPSSNVLAASPSVVVSSTVAPAGSRLAQVGPTASAVTTASQGATFDEELVLIAAAKRELDGGRLHLARFWLAEHAQRFPGGVFSIEREGLSVLARCTESQDPALARGFAARYPQSPMLEQLRRRCGEADQPLAAPSAVDFPKSGK